jgi:histidinol phosphatase-like enzyme
MTQATVQVELRESIETLRALLYRFIPLLNSESIETRARSLLALEKIHREIRHVLASQRFPHCQDQLECWENEGGRTGYVAE